MNYNASNATYWCVQSVLRLNNTKDTALQRSLKFLRQKESLEKDAKSLENIICLKYAEIVLDLNNQLANLDEGYEKLTTLVNKQGEQWYKEIGNVINRIITEINEIKVKHRSILQKHIFEIKQIHIFMKQTLLAIKEIQH